ncbi:hypothetical protein BDR26DRAFT_1004538 [Obelidium mucronatum]|nr:hypothetical protein BDR26DRAFT_1004538 [Obelidium mucronatum]
MSEIDDIFGGKKPKGLKRKPEEEETPEKKEQTNNNAKGSKVIKTKPAAKTATTTSSSTSSSSPEKKLKSSSKPSTSSSKSQISNDEKPKKVETVDFRFVAPTTRPIPPKKKPNGAMDGDEDDGFANSRGSNSSTKTTDDGLRVFYNTDLQIGAGNGDTPDCPFNCWCCY